MNAHQLKSGLKSREGQTLVLFLSGIVAMIGAYVIVGFLSSLYLNLAPKSFVPLSVSELILPTTAMMVAALLLYTTGVIWVGWLYRSIGLAISFLAIRYAALTVMLGGTLCLLLITAPDFQANLSPNDQLVLAMLFGSSFGFLYVFGWRLGQVLAPITVAKEAHVHRQAAPVRRTAKPAKRVARAR